MVGLLRNAAGHYLINRRQAGTHMAGLWEFPGGKRKAGESRWDALSRELAEELGIVVAKAEPLLEILHDYGDFSVRLDAWIVDGYDGEPFAREGQELRWVAIGELAGAGLLPADLPIIDALSVKS